MKNALVVAAIAFLLVSATSCQANRSDSVFPSVTAEPILPHAMKGYELYSWQVGGEWHFSLLPGTNRLKTYQEITADAVAVKGTAAITARLGRLPAGELVFWTTQAIPHLTLPPEGTVKPIKEFCAKSGIEIAIENEELCRIEEESDEK